MTTPLLPVPLSGPAIFVSHGGEAFPSLIMVLQGYGVTVDLVGTTFISKAGITSTTFKTVPDTPFDMFELTLPEGPFSALAANARERKYSLYEQTHDADRIRSAERERSSIRAHQSVVTGCAKIKPLTRAQKLTVALKACHKDKNKSKRTSVRKNRTQEIRAAEKEDKKKRKS